jgi:hypothetical protein
MVRQVDEVSSEDDNDSIPSVSETDGGETNVAGLMGGDSVKSGDEVLKQWAMHSQMHAAYNAAHDLAEEEESLRDHVARVDDSKNEVEVESESDHDLDMPKTADAKKTSLKEEEEEEEKEEEEEEDKSEGEDGIEGKSMQPPRSTVSDLTDGAMKDAPEHRLA